MQNDTLRTEAAVSVENILLMMFWQPNSNPKMSLHCSNLYFGDWGLLEYSARIFYEAKLYCRFEISFLTDF